MSDKEKAIAIINRLPDAKVAYILTFLRGFELNEDIEDDLLCERLYEEYLNDDSEDKHDSISLDEFAKEMGVDL